MGERDGDDKRSEERESQVNDATWYVQYTPCAASVGCRAIKAREKMTNKLLLLD